MNSLTLAEEDGYLMISDGQFGAISRAPPMQWQLVIADDKVFAALERGRLYDELNEMGRLQDHVMTVI